MTNPKIIPFSLRDAPALIEALLPVQKLSAESHKEQMAGIGKTLTALGNYWKGRKPLILARACVLGCLLPATDDLEKDLEIFELLMGMDARALEKRVAAKNSKEGRALLAQHRSGGQGVPYREWVQAAYRPEECGDGLYDQSWPAVNAHLGTDARSFPELVEQLGVMRFGHRPRVADTFCGSGQIPFEAARLGCDVYASDLNPVACMLTWGAFHVIGGSAERRRQQAEDQRELIRCAQVEIDHLDVETDGEGWGAKAFLYCVEVQCPQTGWMVPLLPTRVISNGYRVIAELVPDPANRRYAIHIRTGVGKPELESAERGTIARESKYGEAYLTHQVDGMNYRTKITTLRGDFTRSDGTTDNRLRMWEKLDFFPHPDDLFQERLYCIQWSRPKKRGNETEYEFRSVGEEDLARERIVQDHVRLHLADWQSKGWIPDTKIEIGGPPRYQGLDLIRARGWTHWHHVFAPRQLLVAATLRRFIEAHSVFSFAQSLNVNARLSRWNSNPGPGRAGKTQGVFDNQALNTLYNFACRSMRWTTEAFDAEAKSYPFAASVRTAVKNTAANVIAGTNDIYVTDPPYGDAVKYEEILDFFIAWLRKNPPAEFADWVWDSRRALAIQGDDEAFRRGMVAAYTRMAEHMPDNGIQVIMFTHQSGAIWADMANIVWASGLQVTAAWYVVTETDSALREGSYVKGTVLLVVRKRRGAAKIGRGDLAWEIQEEVEAQVATLTGLNQRVKGLYRDENLFEDADLQMAGYAAALRVLTRYAIIDGRDMAGEALRPRVRGQTTFVDDLIEFAVGEANRALVPTGFAREHWERLLPAERFYLKLLELEARGQRTLDNYQNFAKAFKVRDFKPFMASERANAARLKGASEFGRSEMGESSELYNTALRGVLYALMELEKNVDGEDVLKHLALTYPAYYDQRARVVELAGYLAGKLETIRPAEASAARVLRDLVRNQRM